MKAIILLSYQVWVVLLLVRPHTAQTACTVPMKGGLPDPQPLILVPGGSRNVFGFKLPTPDGNLSFAPGEQVRLVCTGTSNSFRDLGADRPKDILVRCDSGTTFEHDGTKRNFDAFGCTKVARSAVGGGKTRRCNRTKGRLVEIGFQVAADEFVKVLDVCFDEDKMNAFWSKVDLVSVIDGGEGGLDATGVDFTAGDFYADLRPEDLYTIPTQIHNIGRTIETRQAEHLINSTYHLVKGVLSDSANLVYTSQKLATTYFVNAAPQWRTFKTGTWRIVEERVRFYALSRAVDLVVYTGTHGITTLPDLARVPTERELYLSVVNATSKQIPVPAIYWKVVYEPISKKGIVLVGVNNPLKNRDELVADAARYDLCARKRYVTYWYICASVNQQAGFGYCCTVGDFRNFVKSLPQFEVTDLLT